MIKEPNHQENIAIINIQAPNTRAPKCMKQKMADKNKLFTIIDWRLQQPTFYTRQKNKAGQQV